MAFLKKIHEDWQPVEKPNLAVGEMMEFPGAYERLVRGGMALLVDKDGNEIELPGQMFECPVCFNKIEGLQGFTEHVSRHMSKTKVEKVVTVAEKEEAVEEGTAEKEDVKKVAIHAKRLVALEKARAAKAAKKK